MGTITSLNGVPCGDINAVNNLLAGAGGDILKWDDNTFCPVPTATPTPTPTPTPSPTPGGPTPTPTPTPVCDPGCCFVELCYSDRDCSAACQCNDVRAVYLHQPCQDDPCELAYADGIFEDPGCSTPATEGYYSLGPDCWYWNATDLTLTYQGPC
jgi:hypothetical protein